MAFEPHEVVVTAGREFKQYYSIGEEIGRFASYNASRVWLRIQHS